MLIGYTCPPNGEEPGRQNTVDYCLSKCSTPCMTPPLLAALHKADVTNYHQGAYLSSSMLAGSGCQRQVYFERFTDFYEQPTRRYWAFRGTHAHTIIEGAKDRLEPLGWLQEIRLGTTVEYPNLPAPLFDDNGEWNGQFDMDKPLTIQINGTADAYNILTRTLVDMKSMADTKILSMIKGGTDGTYSQQLHDHWIIQLNIYRWLFARTPISDEVKALLKQHGLKVPRQKCYPAPTKLMIQGIGMMGHPVSGMPYAHKERGRGVTLYDIDPVPVWSLTDIEAYVKQRALSWFKALVMRIKPPPVDETKAWMCKSCPFYQTDCFPEEDRLRQGAV